MIQNIQGKRFGRLVCKEYVGNYKWLCQCDCGNEKVVGFSALNNNLTRSCGCLAKEKSRKRQLIDLTGKRFGKLTVVGIDKTVKNKVYWKCKCDCGSEKIVRGDSLTRGIIKSCGCLVRSFVDKSIIGKRFGKLVVKSFAYWQGRRTYWNCLCDCGGTKIVIRNNLTDGHTTSCGCKHRLACVGSSSELELHDYIQELNSNLRHEKTRILDGKEIDIYFPEIALGIEYNGSAFHASLNGVYENKPKDYHRDKFLVARKKNIRLLTIFDVDWAVNKDKIKALIKDIICPCIKIYARKCIVKKITKQEANIFYDQYHLQNGFRLNEINYGLYYNNELVSVMSFGNIRMKHSALDRYELHRYCIKNGYKIIGGAERLFKHFLKEYKPKYIKTYSSNDMFDGNVYQLLGFKYIKQADLPYYWYKNGLCLPREQCQPCKLQKTFPELFNEAPSRGKEDYIMQKRGFCKVYRCGNTIWEWDNTEITN